ncbi:MAG: ATP-binding cassette domain-containing protein [Anaerolineales bacterium]|nr:ATP-binding cassette domain-containing protein [Anaerolineales bacterium]
MLTAHHISKSYNIHTILEDISFSINSGDRIGLVGPNGCGKTTLLRILTGLEQPDEGVITLTPPNLSVGYLAQGFNPDPALSIENALETITGRLSRAETELEELANDLAKDPASKDLQAAYDAALQNINKFSESHTGKSTKILTTLGLSTLPRTTVVKELSGGQKTRLALALVLLRDPKLLLLDEPTNHLDIQMLEWLENWIVTYKGGVLIVSHDRTFLDRTANRILYLNPETHTIKEFTGNYSDFIVQYQNELQKQDSAYRDQVYEIRKMSQDITRTKQHALKVELTTTSRQPGLRRIAKKVAKKARSREKRLQRYINSDDRVEKPKQAWQMKLDFLVTAHQSPEILSLNNLTIGYPGHLPLQKNLSLHISSGDRVALTGPNGCGKTTLLRTIAGKLKPMGGHIKIGHSAVLGYMSQEQELLNPKLTPLETIKAYAPINETDIRSYLHYYLFSGDDVLRLNRNLSYGERARLTLAALVVQGCNFLLLDEPINHLDIPSRSRFEQALTQYHGTVLAVIHDRYFIQQFATDFWIMNNQGIRRETLIDFRL